MKDKRNRFGLSRYVPSAKRRQLRKEAGFGCVHCGFAFCEYEHIDPEFQDATEHDVTKMAFLCSRCHREVTAGRRSKSSVFQDKAAPFCNRPGGKSWGALSFGAMRSSLGRLMFDDCRVILKILGDELLTIEPAEEQGGPVRVNAKLYDGTRLSLQIEDNAIIVGAENWDVEVTGDTLTVRRQLGQPSLIYKFLPDSGVRIERLDMQYKGIRVVVDKDAVRINGSDVQVDAIDAVFKGCRTCFDVRKTGVCMGDMPTLPPRQFWHSGSMRFVACVINTGLCVTAGSELTFVASSINRGIFIEIGAKLSLINAVVRSVAPSQGVAR